MHPGLQHLGKIPRLEGSPECQLGEVCGFEVTLDFRLDLLPAEQSPVSRFCT